MADMYASDSAKAAQFERETQSVARGIERYWKGVAALTEHPTVENSAADTRPGQRMQSDILAALVPRIDQLLEQAITRLSGKGGSDLRKGADYALHSLRAPTLAVITARV